MVLRGDPWAGVNAHADHADEADDDGCGEAGRSTGTDAVRSGLYIDKPDRTASVPVDLPLATAIVVCLVGVIGMGVYPGPWVAAAQRIAQTLF